MLQGTSSVGRTHNVAADVGNTRRISCFFSFWRSDNDMAGPETMALVAVDSSAAPNLVNSASRHVTQQAGVLGYAHGRNAEQAGRCAWPSGPTSGDTE